MPNGDLARPIQYKTRRGRWERGAGPRSRARHQTRPWTPPASTAIPRRRGGAEAEGGQGPAGGRLARCAGGWSTTTARYGEPARCPLQQTCSSSSSARSPSSASSSATSTSREHPPPLSFILRSLLLAPHLSRCNSVFFCCCRFCLLAVCELVS